MAAMTVAGVPSPAARVAPNLRAAVAMARFPIPDAARHDAGDDAR